MAFPPIDQNLYKVQDPYSMLLSTMTHMYPANKMNPLPKYLPSGVESQTDRLANLKAGMLTDFIVRCHGVEYRTHKVILAIHSGYFYRMFSSEMRESYSGEINVEEPTIQPAYLEMLLDYMYTGVIDVTRNCKEILAVSEFLIMEEVSDICCTNLLRSATHDTFLDTWDTLTLYSKHVTESKLIEFLASQFSKVQWTREFLLLSYDRLYTLLKHNKNSGNTDLMSVFRGILRWVRSDIEQRRQNLIFLKEFVSLNNLPLPFLIGVLEDKSLMKEMPQLSVEIMTTIINNRLWLKRKIFILCSIQHATGNVVIECYDCQRQKVASHVIKIDEISTLNKKTVCGFVSQLCFVTPNHIYMYSLDTQDWLKLNYLTKLAGNPKAQCIACQSSIYMVCDIHVEQFELPESYEGWRKKPVLPYQPMSPVLINIEETLYVISADLFIQYLDNRENKWVAIDRRSTFENNEEFILSGFVAATSNGKSMYLLKESNSTIYKVDTANNHDVYYASLPADNALGFIRCMEVSEEGNVLKVLIIIEEGLWMEFENTVAWCKSTPDSPTMILRRSPGSSTNSRWIPKIASGENQSVLFQNRDPIDFAVVTTMHIE